MTTDEQILLGQILAHKGCSVRAVIAKLGLNQRRAHTILRQWRAKRWYGYGKIVDMGRLTEKGEEKAAHAFN